MSYARRTDDQKAVRRVLEHAGRTPSCRRADRDILADKSDLIERLLTATLRQRRPNIVLQRIQTERLDQNARDIEARDGDADGGLIVRGHEKQSGVGAERAKTGQENIGISHPEIPEEDVERMLEREAVGVRPVGGARYTKPTFLGKFCLEDTTDRRLCIRNQNGEGSSDCLAWLEPSASEGDVYGSRTVTN